MTSYRTYQSINETVIDNNFPPELPREELANTELKSRKTDHHTEYLSPQRHPLQDHLSGVKWLCIYPMPICTMETIL
jgi:hypothetical protein